MTPAPNGTPINGAPSAASMGSAGAPFKTTSNILGLGQYSFPPGYYQISVQAFDATGHQSAVVYGNVTLVAANFGNVRVFPNPWRRDRHDNHPITFDRLPLGSVVKIFTVSGHWVKTLTTNIDSAVWDLKNDGGDSVASGIYVYLIKVDGSGDKVTGQIHIIK